MSYDVLVIGAGMSGLAAGIRIAHFGERVAVLEKHSLWGGLNSFYKQKGYRFDVGLHALTNYAKKGERGAPLTRILRALRLKHADLALGEQAFSEIFLPDLHLTFTNEFEHLASQVEEAFPGEGEAFRALADEVRAFTLGSWEETPKSARAELGRRFSEPLLVEALLVPTCYYGSAGEGDVDWDQFQILFQSIFLEGLSRPEGGIRPLLKLLIERFKDAGGELLLNNGVERIHLEDGRVQGVRLEDGTELECARILSSAGWIETRALCGLPLDEETRSEAGRLSFVESISVLDRDPRELGHGAATSFFSTAPAFDWSRPEGLCDLRSGVISSPNNYAAREPLPEGILRLTVLANHDRWCALEEPEYLAQKERLAREAIQSAARFVPDWNPHTVYRDVFTPRTIRHFTSHAQGCVYGATKKRPTGETPIEGLFLCGTDQGYVGVVGTLMSGIEMASRHVLAPAAQRATGTATV